MTQKIEIFFLIMLDPLYASPSMAEKTKETVSEMTKSLMTHHVH